MESILSKPDIDLKDDIRQAFIVAKYEIMKFISGKKILIFGIINAIVLAILTIVIFSVRINDLTTELGLGLYIGVSSWLMLLGATLFSASSLVAEIEERTALMLFTKPIRKGSIFLGKMMASYGLNLAFVILYYIVASVAIAIKTGGFSTNIFASIGYCMLYILALTGIAMLFSALMKKSSSASILTFVFILLVPSIIAIAIQIIMISTGGKAPDMWYILDYASQSVATSIEGAVDNGPRDALVMLVWGTVPLLGSYFLFRRREV